MRIYIITIFSAELHVNFILNITKADHVSDSKVSLWIFLAPKYLYQ